MQRFGVQVLEQLKSLQSCSKRFASSAEVARHRSELFSAEQSRQRENVGRMEKIEVRYLGVPNDETFVLNKNLSTPYDIARHLSEMHCKRSALAVVDSKIPWDMHRPLEESCTVQLLHFNVTDPHVVNRAFWRSCSFLLGAALQNCLRAEAELQLHSFPSPTVKSGSFVHDISLAIGDWEPNKKELQALSAEMRKLSASDLKIERMDVHLDFAKEMFKDNAFKTEHLPNIASQNNDQVTLYRVGDHVDISKGPMIGSSSLLGKCTIAAVHPIDTSNHKSIKGALYRVQGVALPVGFTMNHVLFNILEERAKKLNPARLPTEPYHEDSSSIVAKIA